MNRSAVVSENICRDYARRTDPDVAHAVLLDRTVFYPGGGGQPADTGRLVADAGGSWP
jgi:Ser-tRNA(Ala) deacylase AlaX